MRSSLLGEEQFDIKVPKGLKGGQTFLALVSGHRERMVTVPTHIKGGQEISIEVPLDKKAPAAAAAQNLATSSKKVQGSAVSGAASKSGMAGGLQVLEEGGAGGDVKLHAGSQEAEQAGVEQKTVVVCACVVYVRVCIDV